MGFSLGFKTLQFKCDFSICQKIKLSGGGYYFVRPMVLGGGGLYLKKRGIYYSTRLFQLWSAFPTCQEYFFYVRPQSVR